MIEKQYRLNDYIITEYDNHFYTWETNLILGDHRTGSCFIFGDILIIHSSGHTKNGCLKLEYSEKLERLPHWSKTGFYCSSDSLKEIESGESLSHIWSRMSFEKKDLIDKNMPEIEGEYQLGQYEVTVHSDKAVTWKKHGGPNKVDTGSCIINSGILFLGSKEKEICQTQSRKEWLRKLKRLPRWNKTFAWGNLNSLYKCFDGHKVPGKRQEDPSIKTKSADYKYKVKENTTTLNSRFQSFQFLQKKIVKQVKLYFFRIQPQLFRITKAGFHLFRFFLKWTFKRIEATVKCFRNR